MTAINTNTMSLYAEQAANTNSRALASIMQQLSTGKGINNAVDDVAGMAISARLTSQIRGLAQAVRNANDGISLLQTAEGATGQVTNMLQRMRELAVQASNDTNNDRDRGFLDGEFQQLKAEINRIAQNTEWNGAHILDGSGGQGGDGGFVFQVGANADQTIQISLPNMQAAPEVQHSGYAAIMMISNTYCWVEFGNLDGVGEGQDHLGVVAQLTFGGKTVQHQITQDDIDKAAEGGDALSLTVSQGLMAKLNTPPWNEKYSASIDAFMSNYLRVELKSGVIQSWPTDVEAGFTTGNLAEIAASAIGSGASAHDALQSIDSALQSVNASRANMGAVISRLQFASDNLFGVMTRAMESRSRIEDTDYSQAMTELARRSIIQQASQAMLAQANQTPQLVLQLPK